MSFELVDTERNLGSVRPVLAPEPGVFDNFLAGTRDYTMQGLAKTGRAASMAAGGLLVSQQAMLGRSSDLEVRDRYFRFHDETFQNAVDAWAPKRSETGAAAEIAGALLSTLPLVLANPAAAVASTQLASAEDLQRKGVAPGKAQAVGAVNAASLGLGIWVPILGQTGFQRVLLGGAGFNVGQGVVTRGVSGSILDGTPAAADYQAFDWGAVTLDALLGLAFGGMAHLSPSARKQGEVAWKRIADWTKGLNPSELDALIVLRQAEHLNVDSAPGRLTTPQDIEANVQRTRTAIEQLAQGKDVQVDDLPAPKVEADPERVALAVKNLEVLTAAAERVAKELDIVVETIRIEPPSPPPAAKPTFASEMPPAEPAPKLTVEDVPVRETLQGMAQNEAGWAEVGGRMIRTKHSEVAGDETITRTQWIPKAEWWPGRPGGLNEAQTKEAVRKALAGEKLNAKEKRAVDYMVEIANERIAERGAVGDAEWAAIAQDLKAEGMQPKHRDVVDVALVVKASEVDEAAVETAAVKHENDDAAFMAEIRAILHDNQAKAGAAAPRGGEEGARPAQGEARPDLSLESQTEASLRAKDRQALKGNVEQRASALRDRDVALLTAPDGTAPPREQIPQPTQQQGLFRNEPAAAERPDPVALEAERFANENPDVQIRVGTDENGAPVTKSARQFLDDEAAALRQAEEDANLFTVAAACLLGAR